MCLQGRCCRTSVLAAALAAALAACGTGGGHGFPDSCADCGGDQPRPDVPADDGADGDGSGSDSPDSPLPDTTAEELCADITVNITPQIPTVMVVIDQSGSMTTAFGSTTRWDAVQDSLAAAGSLIDELDAMLRFGLALYTSLSGADPCPLLTVVEPDLNNYDAIATVLLAEEPRSDTPTGESIEDVSDLMVGWGWDGEAAIILATDGEPDTCANPSPSTEAEQDLARSVTVTAVERAFGLGIQTYVISVGEGTVSAAHLQDIANAGLGLTPADPDAPYWVAGSDTELREALRSIVSEALSCVFELNGRLNVEDACFGTVVLNGRELECGSPDGWEAVDETHIELLGAACDEATSGDPVSLEATFPCDVVTIL